MLIDPYFLQCHDEEMLNPPPGVYYRVRGYYQYADYTLVVWAYGEKEEYFTGEILYKGYELIASGAGALEIGMPPPAPASVWDRIDTSANAYGLSTQAAQQLRSLDNYTPLIF